MGEGRAPWTVDAVVAAMASLPVPGHVTIIEGHPAPTAAATLVPIVDLGGQAAVALTKRTGGLSHGHDWVFPGGRVESADESHGEAARRETGEELGIDPATISLVGQMATRGPIITGHVIDVFIGVIGGTLVTDHDPREVADVAVVPIADLLHPSTYERLPMPDYAVGRPAHGGSGRGNAETGFAGDLMSLRHYRISPDEYLWGLQADILQEMLGHLTSGDHDF